METALGRHVIAEFYDCPPARLNEVVAIEQAMVGSAQAAGATIINSTFHHFAPFGVSGVVVIQESHLAIHTWPEYGFAAVDLFTCGDTVSPWTALAYLKENLAAGHVSSMEMRRGQTALMKARLFEGNNDVASELLHARRITKELWFTERTGAIALSVKHEGELLYQQKSQHQRVEVLQTLPMGRMLVLNGVIAATELDEFAMHEMLVHPALLSHPAPRRVLILGGGDGGSAREVLKHDIVEEVHVVEQDGMVVDAAAKWLPQCAEALENDKVHLVIANAQEVLGAMPAGTVDVAIVDAYDPANMEQPQWQAQCEALWRVLAPTGVAVVQLGSPWLSQVQFQERCRALQEGFKAGNMHPFQVSIPSYPTGLWVLAYIAKGAVHPQEVSKERQAQLMEGTLGYYNAEIHAHAWALPAFLKRLVGQKTTL